MKKAKYLGIFIILIAAVALAACQPATPATEEPMAEEPAAEEPAAEEPTAEEPMESAMPEDEWGVIEVAPGDPVRIATNTVTSGAGVDVFGINQNRFAALAVEDLGGEVLGHPIELVAEDTLCSAEGGQTAASKTVNDPSIAAVMGHTCSSSCVPAAEIYAQAGYTMVSPSCTAPSLAGYPDMATHQVSFLRSVFNDLGQGKFAAEWAFNELGARSVATIHDGSPYAQQLVQVFTDNFTALGGEVVAAEAVNVGDTDMRPVLTTIAAAGPDLIYVPIFPAEGGFIAQQRADVGLEDVPMMGADGLQTATFIEAGGDAAEGQYASGPALPESDAFQAVLDKYVAEFNEEPPAPFGPNAYDGILMIVDAIKKVAVEGEDGTLYIGRKALNDALYATDGLQGITGSFTCDERGDCAFAQGIAVYQVQDGAWVQVTD